jgi:hypothetical protein
MGISDLRIPVCDELAQADWSAHLAAMVTCHVRDEIDPAEIEAFERRGRQRRSCGRCCRTPGRITPRFTRGDRAPEH